MRLLLLDGDGFAQTSLLVRELFRQGVDITLCTPQADDVVGLGMYCREILSPKPYSPAYPDFLRCVALREDFDLVVPLCEPLQRICWADSEIPSVFPKTTARQQLVLQNRVEMSRFAKELLVPLPRELEIAGVDELARIADAFGYPFVIRGTQGLAGDQVRIVSDQTAAKEAYEFLLTVSPDPPFAQEYLDGDRCLVGALLHEGRVMQSFAQMTTERYPQPTGPSIRVVSYPDGVLVGHGERILSALGWSGLACAEFIRLRDGTYRFLEINPRPWAAIQASHRAGVPLLTMFARYLVGKPPDAPRTYKAGVACVLFPAYLLARVHAGTGTRASDLHSYFFMLFSIPWSSLTLVFRTLKQVYWEYHIKKVRGGG